MAYSQKEKDRIVNAICEEIANEGTALRTILLRKEMPDSKTFYAWIDKDPDKLRQYARATELRAEKIFEEVLEIADTPQLGTKTKKTDKGIEIMTGDMIEHRRLRVDSRKWMLGKLNPTKYGDRVQNDITIKEQPLFPDVE